MRKLNEHGFSHLLLIILILMVIAGIVFAGLNVWNNRKTTSEDIVVGSSSSEKSETTPPAETVSSPSEAYQLELAEGWVTDTCPDTPDLLFLAPTADLLGKCESESFGMASVSTATGDQRRTESSYTSDSYYGSVTYTEVSIDDLPGYKVTYTIATETELGYPPVGTYEEAYMLYDADADKTYIIGYRQFAADPDHRATFTILAESFTRT